MNDHSQHDYELLDFGEGRKLERFGQIVLDRPYPAAERVAQATPGLWKSAIARFRGSRTGDGEWEPASTDSWTPADWRYAYSGEVAFQLRLSPLPSGQVGIFPEQRENWDWIARQTRKQQSQLGRPLRVLNLFAYTGGSTLAAAAAGAEVVHVDAARNMVERARDNARQCGLEHLPIRWITDDAAKFCQRELKRGNPYDAVVLDPPTYGHGPKGEVWKIESHLLPLLKVCGELTAANRALVVVTCHTPGVGQAELAAYLAEGIFGHCGAPPSAAELFLATRDGRRLPSGVVARWPA